MNTKRILHNAQLCVLAALLLVLAVPAAAQEDKGGDPIMAPELLKSDVKLRDDYTIVVDNTIIEPDVPPVEYNGVIFVPLRFVGQALGAEVSWRPELQQAFVKWDKAEILFTINKYEVDVSGETQILKAPPFLYGQRTMIPLKASAQGGGYKVSEKPDLMVMYRPEDAGPATPETTENKKAEKDTAHGLGSLAMIKDKARKDPITKKIKWPVLIVWFIGIGLWLLRFITAFGSSEEGRFKDKILIGLILGVVVPLIILLTFSAYWAAFVAIGTGIIGLISTEPYEGKLVTMANTAQGLGLICTLFGLGLLIGPAIAERDIAAIGYGIFVKIEPTVTGLFLSIIMSAMVANEARKQR